MSRLIISNENLDQKLRKYLPLTVCECVLRGVVFLILMLADFAGNCIYWQFVVSFLSYILFHQISGEMPPAILNTLIHFRIRLTVLNGPTTASKLERGVNLDRQRRGRLPWPLDPSHYPTYYYIFSTWHSLWSLNREKIISLINETEDRETGQTNRPKNKKKKTTQVITRSDWPLAADKNK